MGQRASTAQSDTAVLISSSLPRAEAAASRDAELCFPSTLRLGHVVDHRLGRDRSLQHRGCTFGERGQTGVPFGHARPEAIPLLADPNLLGRLADRPDRAFTLLAPAAELVDDRLELGDEVVPLPLPGSLGDLRLAQGARGPVGHGLAGPSRVEQRRDAEDAGQVILEIEFALRCLDGTSVDHDRELREHARLGAELRPQQVVEIFLRGDLPIGESRLEGHPALGRDRPRDLEIDPRGSISSIPTVASSASPRICSTGSTCDASPNSPQLAPMMREVFPIPFEATTNVAPGPSSRSRFS